MTVSYSYIAATANTLAFFKLMFRWKGSIWKLVIYEVASWTAFTLLAMFIGHFVVLGSKFEQDCMTFVQYVVKNDFSTPLGFLLGFTIPFCFSRWMDMYQLLAWPDNIAHLLNANINDDALPPEEMSCLRRTFARYICLSYVLLLRDISLKGRKRFPSIDNLTTNGGIITKEEGEFLASGRIGASDPHYWIPFAWMIALIKQYYKPPKGGDGDGVGKKSKTSKGKRKRSKKKAEEQTTSIMSEKNYKAFITQLMATRGGLGDLLSYDWVPMPLAQTQAIMVVISFYSICCVFSCLEPGFRFRNFFGAIGLINVFSHAIILIIYFGWTKSFEVIINPFGDDDDDFEVDWLIDRHWLMLSRVLCDPQMNAPTATLLPVTGELPHTIASCAILRENAPKGPMGSMANEKPQTVDEILPLKPLFDEYCNTENALTPSPKVINVD